MGNHALGTSSRSSSMRPPPVPPPRFPLMTPSASPPVQRPFGRQADGPSPTKKRRMSRTPSLLGPGACSHSVCSASSSSVPPSSFPRNTPLDPADELHSARCASSFKVLNVWSHLADKYARRLDDDDIVDLENETIVKDHGVLKSSDDMFEIGYFADQHEREERLVGEALTPADDEPDELDAFADISENISRSETDGDDHLELARQSKRLPPVRELDPADAADLAEFLEAEKVRKEMFGDLDDHEEDDYEEDKEEGSESGQDEEEGAEFEDGTAGFSRSGTDIDDTEHGDDASGNEEEVYEESVHDDEDGRNIRIDYRSVSTPSGSPEFDIIGDTFEDAEEDEKGAEGTVDVSGHPEGDNGILQVVAEDPLSLAPGEDSEDELGGWEQDEGNTLYSVDDYDDGSEEEGEPESDEERTPTPTPGPRMPVKGKGRGRSSRRNVADRNWNSPTQASVSPATSPASVLQLRTPPRSSSFGPEARNGRLIATYSRKRQRNASQKKKAPLRIASTTSEDSHSEAEIVNPSSSQRTQRQDRSQSRNRPSSMSPAKKFKLVPEVFIDVPPPPMAKNVPHDKIQDNDVVDFLSEEPDDVVAPRQSAKSKGKAKAIDSEGYAQDHETHWEAKTLPRKVSARPSTNASSSSHQDQQTTSTSKPSVNSRKRRRAPSTAVEDYGGNNGLDASSTCDPSPSLGLLKHSLSSRRSVVEEDNLLDEQENGPSSSTASRYRSRSRPMLLSEISSRPISHDRSRTHSFSFSFPPTYPPSSLYQDHRGAPYAASYNPQRPSVPLPNFQDPNAQYHLAQALQSLSILMGGVLPPLVPPNTHGSHASPLGLSAQASGHSLHSWPPHTPQHHKHHTTVETPASAPPTSSPVGSDYSESLPSSPIKQHAERGLGRSQSQSRGPGTVRPKSAIRGMSAPSRSSSRGCRVSFSTPEAIEIKDVVHNVNKQSRSSGVERSDSDVNGEDRRRQRRDSEPSRVSQSRGRMRAQTPGPPVMRPTRSESDYLQPIHNDARQRVESRKPSSASGACYEYR